MWLLSFYFFFLGFFFLTPPAAGAAGGITVDALTGRGLARSFSAGESTSGVVTEGGSVSSCCLLFCIFCINDRFNDSNRLRKMEE